MVADADSLRQRIAEIPVWYHRISLPDGIVTPGINPLDPAAYRLPDDLTGKKGAWSRKPTSKHPALSIAYTGYNNGYKFRFDLEGHPSVMDPAPDWACYDTRNQLLIARQGRVERWSLRDIKRGEPGFVADLNNLEPPPRKSTSEGTD